MKFKVLASGSKGNSSLVQCGNLNILIDVGINYNTLQNELAKVDLTPSDIDAVLITHTHSDHIRGLSTLVKKNNNRVYTNAKLYNDLIKYIDKDFMEINDDCFNVSDVYIEMLSTSHDVLSYGFLIEYKDSSIVYITDTGYIHRKYYPKIANKTLYMIEANHDVEMLMNGPYPYYLKQRVVGDYGHLSNEAAGNCLRKCIGNNTEYIFLAHISENNNTKEMAYSKIIEMLEDIDFDKNKIIITDQYASSELVEV